MGKAPLHRRIIGGLAASTFSLAYIIGPVYIISAIVLLAVSPTLKSLLYCVPLLLSALLPAYRIPGLLKSYPYQCMLDYFDYEEMFEFSDEELEKLGDELGKKKRSVILAAQPHGVLSFGGICAGANARKKFENVVTAAAAAVLATPIIKNVVGQFNLIDASAPSMKKHLAKGGCEGAVVLYVGGIAELFKCSLDEETLYLNDRKGFIKLALREGAEIVPLYFFGNTAHLSIPKAKVLEKISRSLQVSLTIFWGLWGLPIPRPVKVIPHTCSNTKKQYNVICSDCICARKAARYSSYSRTNG